MWKGVAEWKKIEEKKKEKKIPEIFFKITKNVLERYFERKNLLTK